MDWVLIVAMPHASLSAHWEAWVEEVARHLGRASKTVATYQAGGGRLVAVIYLQGKHEHPGSHGPRATVHIAVKDSATVVYKARFWSGKVTEGPIWMTADVYEATRKLISELERFVPTQEDRDR